MLTALLVVLILVALIVAHEFGHFLAAKFSRVKVEEFGIGYPPRAFTIATIGGTEYTLNWIPFGGFVRLYGDQGEDQRGRGSLVEASRLKQAAILIAGVAMNAAMGWFLFALSFHAGVPQPIDTPLPGEAAHLIVANIVAGSPADGASLKAGDELLGIRDTVDGSAAGALTPEAVVDFVRERGGRQLALSYKRADVEYSTNIIPANAVIPGAAAQPALGIALTLFSVRSIPWGQSFSDAGLQTISAFETVGADLWSLARTVIRGSPDLSGVVGPIGIVGYVNDAARSGFGSIFLLAGFISINLAVINLLPIPALDGGRLLVLFLEVVLRRDAPRLAIQLLNALGVSLIILLMVAVSYHDIGRLLT
ncbi:MAG: hypothetical protein RLZZ416_126 [Candidatus Parcubacteria bacterium]|jgi:regulator of sigma E protease